MKIITITMVIFFSSLYSFSQIEDYCAGGRSYAMGKVGVTLQDTWAVFNNPAATNEINNPTVGLFYSSRFLMKETGFAAMSFTSPFLGGTAGFGATHFGFEYFQQNRIAFGYSQQLFRNFSMGAQIDYLSIRQPENYGNFNAITFELGLLAKATENLSIGVHAFNPLNLSYFEDSKFKMPVAIKLGLSYMFSKVFLLAIETAQSINGNIPVFKSGLEYKVNEHFYFRGGISMKPVEYSAGIGYNANNLYFDIAYSYHQILGSTPNISIHYEF